MRACLILWRRRRDTSRYDGRRTWAQAGLPQAPLIVRGLIGLNIGRAEAPRTVTPDRQGKVGA
jgi:hypothetical protein